MDVLRPENRLVDLNEDLIRAAETAKRTPLQIPDETETAKRTPLQLPDGRRLPGGKRPPGMVPNDKIQKAKKDDDKIEEADDDEDIESVSCVSLAQSDRGSKVKSPVRGKKRQRSRSHSRSRSRSRSQSRSTSRSHSRSRSRSKSRSRSRSRSHSKSRSRSRSRSRSESRPSHSKSRSSHSKSRSSHSKSRSSHSKSRSSHSKSRSSHSKSRSSQSRSHSQAPSIAQPEPHALSFAQPEPHTPSFPQPEPRAPQPSSFARPEPPEPQQKKRKTSSKKSEPSPRCYPSETLPEIPPAPEDPVQNDKLFETVMRGKSNTNTETVLSSKASQRKSTILSLDSLLLYLPSELRKTTTAIETVKMIDSQTHPKGKKSCNVIDVIKWIRYYPPLSEDESSKRLKIDTTGYLFCELKEGNYGYDHESIQSNEEGKKYTFLYAIGAGYKDDDENSLDLVFRATLKKMAMNIPMYDEDSPTNLNNPMFLSILYLDYTLISMIIEHYFTELQLNILEFFTSPCPELQSERLKNLIVGCRCEFFLRKLIACYNLTPENYKTEFSKIFIIQNMRAWTSRTVQAKTSVAIINALASLNEKESFLQFADKFSKLMRPVLKTYKDLIHVMQQAGQIGNWMFFGITIDAENDPLAAIVNMALSYYLVKGIPFENIDRGVVFNYPLACLFRQQTKIVREIAMVTKEDYSAMCELANKVRQQNK